MEVLSDLNNGQSLQLQSSPLKAADRVKMGSPSWAGGESRLASPEIKVVLSGMCGQTTVQHCKFGDIISATVCMPHFKLNLYFWGTAMTCSTLCFHFLHLVLF